MTTSSITDSINGLLKIRDNAGLSFSSAPELPPIPAKSKTVKDSAAASGGIASPLTEDSRVQAVKTIPVPTGATTVEVHYVQSVTMLDANGRSVVFDYALEPADPPP